MPTLHPELRRELEKTVKAARVVAETGAHAALEALCVPVPRPYDGMSEADKALRNRLRAHARNLGDARTDAGAQGIWHLTQEVAYEHWHRMLFARFLAENHLLMFEGAPATIAECEELARDRDPAVNLGAKSGWELAGKLAARALPQVFKPQAPAFDAVLAPEHQKGLEDLLAKLPAPAFTASDALGWVYQFWQAQRKDDVNAAGNKIGADEISAVTQLFTEPYMVDFLLHNSIGAWWQTRFPGQPCPVTLDYLRLTEHGTPAAGKFEGWPGTLADFKLLDPCCGSGHFLVAAFLLLVPLRQAAENLSAADAVDAVLRDNLHGLELDARCVEIAVFALALAAWRYPNEEGQPLGVRAEMPSPKVACCGLAVTAKAEDWEKLGKSDADKRGLSHLHGVFKQAPLLGSLLDPKRGGNALFEAEVDAGLLEKALQSESEDAREDALVAKGLLEASRLLGQKYHLVVTNVPYLARGKQEEALKDYCETHYKNAKNDLANVFLERCLELSKDRGAGVVQIVMPQNWLFLGSYKKQREELLKRVGWNLVGLLGAKSFQTPMWDFNVQLLTLTNAQVGTEFLLRGIDACAPRTTHEKEDVLRDGEIKEVNQKGQLGNPDSRVVLEEKSETSLLVQFAVSSQGIKTGDDGRVRRVLWEVPVLGTRWAVFQTTVSQTIDFGGLEGIVDWSQNGTDMARLQGRSAWEQVGVAVSQMNALPVARYNGVIFDSNVAPVVVKDKNMLGALWCYCSSRQYHDEVRKIDQKIAVANATLVKVPFDLAHWQKVAAERYPAGLPKPYSNDPTQWLFHGHPKPSTAPLQVAVARLLGYAWPAESDPKMELSDEARSWIRASATLAPHADADGIVCLPAIRGEDTAANRLRALLREAFGADFDERALLAGSECADLETYLRDAFFAAHCALFHHRPFIWHLWDGRADGFHALVNYHKLAGPDGEGRRTLEALTHTYLAEWIARQRQEVVANKTGAELRLEAAVALQKKLEFILAGEPPCDLFIRWKALKDQPVGWEPDLNDGVRLNARPFILAGDVKKKGAGLFRDKVNLKWDSDRGKEPESLRPRADFPWFWTWDETASDFAGTGSFDGVRHNNLHYTVAAKKKAKGQ